jgi:hypothetical protein
MECCCIFCTVSSQLTTAFAAAVASLQSDSVEKSMMRYSEETDSETPLALNGKFQLYLYAVNTT